MLALLIIIILGIGVALLAMQNPQTVVLYAAHYRFEHIPLYAVVLGALLFGIFISWVISMFDSLFTSLTLRRKDSKIKDTEKENIELVKRVHQLELENEHLKKPDTGDTRSM